jgi:uncharacterized RDD family membrane protein YckC
MENTTPKLARLRYRLFALMVESVLTEFIVVTLILGTFVILNVKNSPFTFALFWVLYYLGILVIDFLNNFVLVKMTNGKSLGKALFNIRILRSDFTKATSWNIFKHWFILTGIGLSMNLLGLLLNYLVIRKMPLKQGIHNIIADTVVVESQTSNNKFVLLWGGVAIASILTLGLGMIFAVTLTSNTSNLDLLQLFTTYSGR